MSKYSQAMYDYWYKTCMNDGLEQPRTKELKIATSHQNVCIEEMHVKLPVWNSKCESCRGKCNLIHNGKQFKDRRY